MALQQATGADWLRCATEVTREGPLAATVWAALGKERTDPAVIHTDRQLLKLLGTLLVGSEPSLFLLG